MIWAAKQAARRGTQTLLKLGINKTLETTKFVVTNTPAATKYIGDTLVEQHKHLNANTQKVLPGVLAASAVAASVDLTDLALAGTAVLYTPGRSRSTTCMAHSCLLPPSSFLLLPRSSFFLPPSCFLLPPERCRVDVADAVSM